MDNKGIQAYGNTGYSGAVGHFLPERKREVLSSKTYLRYPMDPTLEKDLNDIADFCGEKLGSLMPALKLELELTPVWPVVAIVGSYLHFRMDAQGELGKGPEGYTQVHTHALAHTLALPLTQDFMKRVMEDSFNAMAGVTPQPSYDLGDFQEENL